MITTVWSYDFEGVIALFHVEYFIRYLYAQLLLHFKREFLKTLHAFLLPYEESHTCVSLQQFKTPINRQFDRINFEGVNAPFHSEYLIKMFLHASPPTF